MEKIVTIIDQRPLSARSYTGNDGQAKVFYSRGFVLSDGIDEFYAEMQGDMARESPDYDTSRWHRVQTLMRCRKYTDKNQQERHENQIIINKMF